MRTSISLYAALAIATLGTTTPAAACEDSDNVASIICQSLSKTWNEGEHDLYLPFHAHHLRFAYSKEKIDSFREDSWGIGYGRSRYDEKGNWQGLYAMSFLDSHSKQEPMVGYGHQWMWGDRSGLHAGLGYTAFFTARSDVMHYIPFPGILPIASINYNRQAVNMAYLPGGKGNGNILFFWARFGL